MILFYFWKKETEINTVLSPENKRKIDTRHALVCLPKEKACASVSTIGRRLKNKKKGSTCTYFHLKYVLYTTKRFKNPTNCM